MREGCATRGEHTVPRTKKMLSRKTALALVQRRQWPKAEVLLQRRPPDASQMPNMWELPAIKEGHESEDMLLLTVRHSITNTNYYVTVYGLTMNEQKLLAKDTGERVWVPVLDLLGAAADRPHAEDSQAAAGHARLQRHASRIVDDSRPMRYSRIRR